MLLRDLLAVPELRLRLLVGTDAALDRPVRWVYTTDLIDPGRYLSGGELVISGLVWRNEPGDSELFVDAIADAGAAALAAGEALFHHIPTDLEAACRRRGIVLIAVPEEVSFAAVTEQVTGSVTAARGDRLAARLGRQRELLSAVAGGMGLTELSGRVSETIGVVCRIFTPTGRAIVPGPVPLATSKVDLVVQVYLTADRLPANVSGQPGYSVFPVGPALAQRLTSWFVVVVGPWQSWSADISDAVGELVAFAALDRSRRNEGRRVARTIADDAIRLITAGASGQPETAARLRQVGLDPAGRMMVVVAGFVDRPDLTETAVAVLEDAAAHLGPPVAAVTSAGLAVALVAGTQDPDPSATLRTALERLEPALGGLRLTVGISRPSGAEALSGAIREAEHARELARLRTGPLNVVTDAEVTSHVALLAMVPDEVRRAFASRVLDPVLDYDARNDAGLVETLEAFLDHSGSWSRVAQHLHLHVNTVRYRISRVEELTGRDLGRFEDRVDVFLALRSR